MQPKTIRQSRLVADEAGPVRGAVLLAIGCGLLLGGCDSAMPGGAVGPSPIASFDKTRLWMLHRASPIGEGRRCGDYYQAPDDPRYRGSAQECEAWTLDYRDYLRLNGMPDLEAAHVRDPAFWQWVDQKQKEIIACTATVRARKLPPRDGEARRQKRHDYDACDPYDNALNNEKKTLKELGITLSTN